MSLYEEDDTRLKISSSRFIKVESFNKRFGEKHDYKTLMNHENTDEKWKKIFEWLREKGVLN